MSKSATPIKELAAITVSITARSEIASDTGVRPVVDTAFGKGSGGALIVAHVHDEGALLAGQMLIYFCHGGTSRRSLQLALENARQSVPKHISSKPWFIVYSRGERRSGRSRQT
jgi:hypothetical protein